MKKEVIRSTLFNIIFVILTCYLLKRLISQFLFGMYTTVWNISEWLINYEGGFVRRGIRGEIILYLYKWIGIEPFLGIRLITFIAFCLICLFFIKGFMKKGYPIFIIPSICLLGNPILNNFWMKSDSVLCLLFISTLYITIKKYPLYQLWVNLLIILGILIHETFIIIYVPILILLFSSINSYSINTNKFSIINLIRSCLILLPSFVVFCLIIFTKGTNEMVTNIWYSWHDIPIGYDMSSVLNGKIPRAIDAISYGIKEGLMLYSGSFVTLRDLAFSDGYYGPLMLFICIIMVYYVLSNINKFDCKILGVVPKSNHNKSMVSNVLIFQFCMTLPLYILGFDYGRWIFFWSTSSFIILILLPEAILHTIIPQKITTWSSQFNLFLNSCIGESKTLAYVGILLICFPLCMWTFETDSWIQIILKTISSAIRFIYDQIWYRFE